MSGFSKSELNHLAAGIGLGGSNDPDSVAKCVEFVLTESRGHWHNRARALMCRRLKHCELSPPQRRELVDCILGRLAGGRFTEQFRDQLRLAIHLDAGRAFEAARQCLHDSKDYVRRLALWVVSHDA